MGKLIEKVIGDRLQFHVVSNNFIYQSQLSRLKFKSTLDAGVALIHFIHMRWVKNLSISTLAFDIYSSYLGKWSLIKIFSNYLFERKTHYFWNNFSLPSFNINVGVGQGSALSPILSALYLLSFLHILEKQLKITKFQFHSYCLLTMVF